jgi:hypothetical protein
VTAAAETRQSVRSYVRRVNRRHAQNKVLSRGAIEAVHTLKCKSSGALITESLLARALLDECP